MLVDLQTKVVSPNDGIWVVFPGKRRRFFRHFQEHERIFLELPALGIEYVEGGAEDRDILRRIRRSFAYESQALALSKGRVPVDANDDVASYSSSTKDGTVNSMLGCVRSLFFKMQVGDLVMVPGKGSYGEVLFGEILTPFSAEDNIKIERWGSRPVNTRRVRWVKHIPERRVLPKDIAKHMEHPPSVHMVPRNPRNDRVFGFAYDSFITDKSSETIINAPRYSGQNPKELLNYIKLITFYSAMYYASQSGAKASDIRALSLDGIISRYLPADAFEQYQISFASPGFSRIRPREMAAALGIGAMVGVGGYVGFQHIPDDAKLYVTNSKGQLDDGIKNDVETLLRFSHQTMTETQKKEVDELAASAYQSMGVTSTAEIVDDEDN